MTWKVDWSVFVNGKDMTAPMRPFLISVSVVDRDGTTGDSCQLQFDDSGGQVAMPADGAKVQVYLQGTPAFEGVVDSVRSTGSRGGGRTLSVSAKGFDAKGKVKERLAFHQDDATLQQFLDKAAAKAGLTGIAIDPALADTFRDYWSADNQSFLELGEQIARELGATFKVRGDKAVLAKRGQGMSASGASMPIVTGEVGRNVISWSVSPIVSRRKAKTVQAQYFDRASAGFKTVDLPTDIEDGQTVDVLTSRAVDEAHATSLGSARKIDNERELGGGSVDLDLTVEAQAEGTFVLSGARPGVDGTYRIVGVTHSADRSGGSTTSLELKQPGSDTGKDNRAKVNAAAPSAASPPDIDLTLPEPVDGGAI